MRRIWSFFLLFSVVRIWCVGFVWRWFMRKLILVSVVLGFFLIVIIFIVLSVFVSGEVLNNLRVRL